MAMATIVGLLTLLTFGNLVTTISHNLCISSALQTVHATNNRSQGSLMATAGHGWTPLGSYSSLTEHNCLSQASLSQQPIMIAIS